MYFDIIINENIVMILIINLFCENKTCFISSPLIPAFNNKMFSLLHNDIKSSPTPGTLLYISKELWEMFFSLSNAGRAQHVHAFSSISLSHGSKSWPRMMAMTSRGSGVALPGKPRSKRCSVYTERWIILRATGKK